MGITGTQRTHTRFAVPALTGSLWVASGLGFALLMQVSTVPVSFAALLLPRTAQFNFGFSPGPAPGALLGQWTVGILAGVLVAVLTAALLAVRGPGQSRAHRFLSAWMCVTLASAAGAMVLGMGGILADWPPMRLAWLFDSFIPSPATGAYWGLLWGWLPALLAARRSAADASGREDVSGRKAASGRKASRAAGRAHRPAALPAAAAVLAGFAVLTAVPVVDMASVDQNALVIPEPLPTEEPVVYGAELTGPVIEQPDSAWCGGGEVQMGVDGWDAAAGSRAARLTLEVIGDRPCTVRGYPDLAFNRNDGWAMDITAVHGGGMMTTDSRSGVFTLEPGQMATAQIGWRGTAGAGMPRVGMLLAAPYSGTLRQPLEVDLDLTEPGFLTVTSWTPADADALPPGSLPED